MSFKRPTTMVIFIKSIEIAYPIFLTTTKNTLNNFNYENCVCVPAPKGDSKNLYVKVLSDFVSYPK